MKVCFIGTGSIARRHIKNIVHICCSKQINLRIDVLRHNRTSLNCGIADYINNEYFNIAEIESFYDAIFITNPTYLHYSTIKTLKSYSKNFFVEKPVFSTLELSIESLGLPAENKYYVACPLRYSQVIMYAKKLVKEIAPFSVRAVCSSYLPDWRPGTDYRKSYSAIKEQGGGVCIDLIHEWDYLCDIFGVPEEVLVFHGKYSHLEITSEDLAIYMADFKSFLLELHLDYFGRKATRRLELLCKDGKYVFDILNSSVYKNDNLIERFSEEINDKYLLEMDYFLELCSSTLDSKNTLYNAVKIQTIAAGKDRANNYVEKLFDIT